MKIGVVMFPGSDGDVLDLLTRVLKATAMILRPEDVSLGDVQGVILSGGQPYGDTGFGARAAGTPVIEAVRDYAGKGGVVLGLGHGFQVLMEARLLPGVYELSHQARMSCRDVYVRVERSDTPFTGEISAKTVLRLPIAHRLGRLTMEPEALDQMEKEGCVILRYCNSRGEAVPESNPDASVKNIAGLVNAQGNVMGMMARPERYSEAVLGGISGLSFFTSLMDYAGRRFI
jgi:phosphoribosylformylglycinamidine synthase